MQGQRQTKISAEGGGTKNKQTFARGKKNLPQDFMLTRSDVRYGGVVDGATLRKRISWPFFIEEHKIFLGALETQQKRQIVEKG